MRRFRPSASMVVALMALVFSMAGTGWAASHGVRHHRYLVHSLSQIAPKVRHELVGGTPKPVRVTTRWQSNPFPPGYSTEIDADCNPKTEALVGGGYRVNGSHTVSFNSPATSWNRPWAWLTGVVNTSHHFETLTVYAICQQR